MRSMVSEPLELGMRSRPMTAGRREAAILQSPSSDIVSARYCSIRTRQGLPQVGPVATERSRVEPLAPKHVVLRRTATNALPGPPSRLSSCDPRHSQRQRRHRSREQHAARVLALAEPRCDFSKRQFLEFAQNDDLAVGL